MKKMKKSGSYLSMENLDIQEEDSEDLETNSHENTNPKTESKKSHTV